MEQCQAHRRSSVNIYCMNGRRIHAITQTQCSERPFHQSSKRPAGVTRNLIFVIEDSSTLVGIASTFSHSLGCTDVWWFVNFMHRATQVQRRTNLQRSPRNLIFVSPETGFSKCMGLSFSCASVQDTVGCSSLEINDEEGLKGGGSEMCKHGKRLNAHFSQTDANSESQFSP